MSTHTRRYPIGAEVTPDGTHYRVWAPKRRAVTVVFDDAGIKPVSLSPDGDGHFAGLAIGVRAGALYKFRLDDEQALYPDPISRYQPHGPHGSSQVVDSGAFKWTDAEWKGLAPAGQVLYELHIGTLTGEGTWAAATRELASLKELGVTTLEVMPIPEFAGEFGWGYDGVALYAPYHRYGTPDDFRAFVDAAHALGLGVILDVVYNHLGPDGNYVGVYSDHYFDAKHMTDWGEALNFDGEQSGPVRDFFLYNAMMYVEEYHLDGFRFDATQAIVDTSPEHILAVINRRCRAAVPHRGLYLINENEPQETKLVRPAKQGGYGLDALWNDDFHHAALVALSGHNEAYYTDYLGTSQEFVSSAKYGYLYQGQRYKWQRKRRGTPGLDLPPTAYVHFLQNHDQVANSGRGYRIHQITSPGQLKAMTAFWLLMPQTPMLFQGQEYAASQTFHYFANHNPELTELIRQGRAKELSQFPSVATPSMQNYLIDPGARSTFERSKLNRADRDQPGQHKEIYELHKDLLRLRREEPVFARVPKRGDFDSAMLGPNAFVLRYFGSATDGTEDDDRLVIVNLGSDVEFNPAPEPLLAPPLGCRWAVLLSTEEPQYGGSGTPHPDTEQEGWLLYGRCTTILCPVSPDHAGNVGTRHVVAASSQDAKVK